MALCVKTHISKNITVHGTLFYILHWYVCHTVYSVRDYSTEQYLLR